jgi:hypothetical protein
LSFAPPPAARRGRRFAPWGAALALLAVLAACAGSSSSGGTCTPPVACDGAGTRSYQGCTSGDGASCSIHASDGTAFDCASCGDCAASDAEGGELVHAVGRGRRRR